MQQSSTFAIGGPGTIQNRISYAQADWTMPVLMVEIAVPVGNLHRPPEKVETAVNRPTLAPGQHLMKPRSDQAQHGAPFVRSKRPHGKVDQRPV